MMYDRSSEVGKDTTNSFVLCPTSFLYTDSIVAVDVLDPVFTLDNF